MNSPLRRIGFWLSHDKEGTARVSELLGQACRRAGIEVLPMEPAAEDSPSWEGLEALICLGGDGTMLSAAAWAARHGVILGGVNLGRLGFLTTCSGEEISKLAEILADGSFEVRERAMLQARVQRGAGGDSGSTRLALNELSLMRAQMGKMVDLDVEVNGRLLNRYHADGVLVATPSGSTAYSLSAGGPLIWPEVRVLCVTPVCPHSLTNRSVILPDDVQIALRPRERRGRRDDMIFSLDGRRTYRLKLDETLLLERAPVNLRLLLMPGSNFAALLRAKMRWQGYEVP
ncbi:MAG: NAD(+)/NADH kinase [Akkermansiaceae bacterium]|nr:NAD(+)/NADH kinase [Akkermansiaceae bacterium]